MICDDEDLSEFLKGFGFKEKELESVLFELESFKTIPGTTIKRYINRIISTIEQDDRPTFLKGIMVGVTIRKTADDLAEEDITEEERRIDHEIKKLRLSK